MVIKLEKFSQKGRWIVRENDQKPLIELESLIFYKI